MRFKKPSPADADDPEIAALLADIDSSIASFESRLREYQSQEAPPDTEVAKTTHRDSVFPELDPDALRKRRIAGATPPAPAQTAPRPPPPDADLLAELAFAADERDAAQRRAEASDMELRRRFDAALKPAFDYLHQLAQHLDVLQPPLAASYALGRDIAFAEPRWRKGSADYRSAASTELALVQSVVLRATCSATAPPFIVCPEERADALRNELSLINVKVLDESPAAQAGQVRFRVAPEILLQIHLAADFAEQKVVVRTRNVAGFGLAAYTVAPADLTRGVLDGIGRCLLGRQRQMPPPLNAVPFTHGLDQKPNR